MKTNGEMNATLYMYLVILILISILSISFICKDPKVRKKNKEKKYD